MNKILKKHYHEKVLETACDFFDLPFEKAKLIKANWNMVFDLGDSIVRLTHSKIRDLSLIETEVDFLLFLNEKEFDVVRLIPSKNKNYIEQIGTKENYFSALCFEKIIGNRVSKEAWNEQHFKELGQLTGKLHQLGNTYPEKENLNYPNWNEIPEHYAYKHLPEDDRELKKIYEYLVKEMEKIPINESNYGLVHYDIHQGNYLITKKEKTAIVFDFEMLCRSWYINDIAIVLYYADYYPKIETRLEFQNRFMNAFWQGYETEYQINPEEKKYIPILLLYRDLLVYGFLNELWGNKELSEGEAAYLNRLSHSIEERRSGLKL